MGCTNSKHDDEDIDFRTPEDKLLHLFHDCADWMLRGEMSLKPKHGQRTRIVELIQDKIRQGSQFFTRKDGNDSFERGDLFHKYDHLHSAFYVQGGKGKLDYFRKSIADGKRLDGTIEVICNQKKEIDFIFKDSEMEMMHGIWYDGIDAHHPYHINDEGEPDFGNIVIRGEFRTKSGEEGDFDFTAQKSVTGTLSQL